MVSNTTTELSVALSRLRRIEGQVSSTVRNLRTNVGDPITRAALIHAARLNSQATGAVAELEAEWVRCTLDLIA